MTTLPKCALIAAIASVTIASSAFAQTYQPPGAYGDPPVRTGPWPPGLYNTIVPPGVQRDYSLSPGLTGGGSFGYNNMNNQNY